MAWYTIQSAYNSELTSDELLETWGSYIILKAAIRMSQWFMHVTEIM